MPPRGHYLAAEAGRLAGVSGDQIGQWARRGYIRASQSEGSPKVYAFQDVAEAMVVHELAVRNVTRRSIKAAIEALRSDLGTDWPLTQAERQQILLIPKDVEPRRGANVAPAKRAVVIDYGSHKRDAPSGDEVLVEVDLVHVRADLSRGGWVVRELPGLEHIEVNPERMSGRPTIRGHRVAADEIARTVIQFPTARAGLRDDYDLVDEEIDDAVRWWKAVRRYEGKQLAA